jgi:hypothetical protein
MDFSIYPEGDFWFILCPIRRKALEHDYNLVKRHKLWEYLKKKTFDDTDFMAHMRQYGWWFGHTGHTLSLTLKNLEFIAKHGWGAFVNTMH